MNIYVITSADILELSPEKVLADSTRGFSGSAVYACMEAGITNHILVYPGAIREQQCLYRKL